jgi:predicted DNA-binding transcriptional regulator AlpA
MNDRPSFTINEWCALRKVSRGMFYKLADRGQAPRTHNVGVKRLISPDADAEWLRRREAESAPQAA